MAQFTTLKSLDYNVVMTLSSGTQGWLWSVVDIRASDTNIERVGMRSSFFQRRTGSGPTHQIVLPNWLSNSRDLNRMDLPCLGDVGGLSQAPSKTEYDRRTQETLQMIWDSLHQGPIDKAVKEFPKRLNYGLC